MVTRIVIFLILNFAALGIGSIFTGKGVPSDWYITLDKAPWTPPGWMFGAAWTTIMICFSVYMAQLWPAQEKRNLILALFIVQWVLNVAWNPLFFHFHYVGLALVVISMLTLLLGYMLYDLWPLMKIRSALLLPYLIWLIIATSLNAYIYLKN